MLQGEYTHYYPLTEEVSIPLKSGRCCKNGLDHLAAAGESLNPFEVREVLQEEENMNQSTPNVSIPLKSGRCCKEESKRRVQDFVSIPLKSGRCCKHFADGHRYRVAVSIPLKSGRCCKSIAFDQALTQIRSQSL